MHHISLPSLHGHDVELLGRERKTPISFFFLNFNITPEEFLNFKQIVGNGARVTYFETARTCFLSGVFAAVAVVVAYTLDY